MRLGIGTAQFGFSYGLANRVGKVPLASVKEISRFAQKRGVRLIDTAAGYGESEKALGEALSTDFDWQIVTKAPAVGTDVVSDKECLAIEEAFRRSLTLLKRNPAYGLLIHKASDLLLPGGERIFSALQQLKAAGLVTKIGVSVYSGQEINAVLEKFPIDLVQLPLSVFDQRLLSGGSLDKLKKAGVEIHCRSIFLQGLLLMHPEDVPSALAQARPMLEKFQQFAKERGLLPFEAALAFVRSLPQLNACIVGVESLLQFKGIVEAFERDDASCHFEDFAAFALSEDELLNPARWRL